MRENTLSCRLVDKPGFTVIGQTRKFTTIAGANFKLIPLWWNEFVNSPDYEELTSLSDKHPGKVTGGVILGIDFGSPDSTEFSYGIGVEVPEPISSKLFVNMEIASATWAIFNCTLDKMQATYKYIFSEWFLSSGYKHDTVPHIEVYLAAKPSEKMKCELWIPIRKKVADISWSPVSLVISPSPG
jgi:AraC family transcriptional regulator